MEGAPRSLRRLLLVLGAAVALLCLAAPIVFYLWFVGNVRAKHPVIPTVPSPSRSVTATGSPQPSCPTARLGVSDLGELAWVSGGQLTLYDLNRCKQTVVAQSGASAPVRFSSDGSWIAFGKGDVVSSAGGAATSLIGSGIMSWQWSPTADVLVGVTKNGSVVTGGPGTAATTLLPKGSGVIAASFSPDGKELAISRKGKGIQILRISGGPTKTVLPDPSSSAVPQVAGWSADGKWIIYWRAPVKPNGIPLDAVPVTGGPWVNLYDPVVPHPDLITTCGAGMAITGGAGLQLDTAKQIIVTSPPSWSFLDRTSDFSRSWFWPACSPDGRWLAVTDALDQGGSGAATAPRALWLFSLTGSTKTLLVSGSNGAVEYPRWSSRGSVIMVIVRSTKGGWQAPGKLVLLRIDPGSGKLMKITRPLADLGAAPGPGGDEGWWAISDWYRPKR